MLGMQLMLLKWKEQNESINLHFNMICHCIKIIALWFISKISYPLASGEILLWELKMMETWKGPKWLPLAVGWQSQVSLNYPFPALCTHLRKNAKFYEL